MSSHRCYTKSGNKEAYESDRFSFTPTDSSFCTVGSRDSNGNYTITPSTYFIETTETTSYKLTCKYTGATDLTIYFKYDEPIVVQDWTIRLRFKPRIGSGNDIIIVTSNKLTNIKTIYIKIYFTITGESNYSGIIEYDSSKTSLNYNTGYTGGTMIQDAIYELENSSDDSLVNINLNYFIS